MKLMKISFDWFSLLFPLDLDMSDRDTNVKKFEAL